MTTQTEQQVDKLLTARQVAETLAVSKATVRRLNEAGDLPVVKLTPRAHRRYRQRDIEAAIERGLTKEEP